MNNTPPPIQPQQFPRSQPPYGAPNTGNGKSLLMIAGAGLLAITLFEVIRQIFAWVQILDMLSYFGGDFVVELLLASNYQYFWLAFIAIGGLLMLQKKKLGWSLGFGATGFSILSLLILLGVAVVEGVPLWRAGGIQMILMVLTSLISIVVFILLLMPDLRKTLKIGSTEIVIGIGVGAFLVLDFVIVVFVLRML